MLKHNYKQKNISENGFTLVEMLVTLSVFSVITALTLANYPKFNTQTAITGLAQQIAISIREAQVYGVSVRNSSTTSSFINTNVYPSYGIFFGKPVLNTTYGNQTAYSIFFDTATTNDGAPYYRPRGDWYFTNLSELVETVRIQNGSKIIELCGVKVGETVCTPANAVNVVFRRPNPDANIYIVTDNLTWPFSSPTIYEASQANITIRSKDESYTKVIQVFSSGQVNVE